ncbi:MAG: hypothetical protein OK455_10935 [Thaumarchaeota archaeon]|nr:hypothetical protein [Nitrososphaerota archaeon]
MGGFLVLPVIPIQFTSIITAIVWSISGVFPAMVFLVAGTFLRVDSATIFLGIQQMASRMFPSFSTTVDGEIAVLLMFVGNLATAYLFKRVVRSRLLNRIPPWSVLF